MSDNTNILIVGVGGQGTLFASTVIADVIQKSGLDVKQSEVHGMAQRGGSVVTYIRFGSNISSPLVEKGGADIVVSFEKLEALRWAEYLKPKGKLIVNDQEIPPMPVILGVAKYPDNIYERLEKAGIDVVKIPAYEAAKNAGNPKAVNVVLMGVLARFLSFDKKAWEDTVASVSSPKAKDVNMKAFAAGWGNS